MIPAAFITDWGNTVGWPQDLDQLLSTRQFTYDIDAAAELIIAQLLGRIG